MTSLPSQSGINILSYQLDKVTDKWALQQQLIFTFTQTCLKTLEFFFRQALITREIIRIQLKSKEKQEISFTNPVHRLIEKTPIKWQKNLIKLIHLKSKDPTQQSSLFEFKLEEDRITTWEYLIDPIKFFQDNLPEIKLKLSPLTMIDYHPQNNFNQFTLGKHTPTLAQFGQTILNQQGEKIMIKSYKNISQGQHHESRKDRAGCLIKKILLIQHMRKYQFPISTERSKKIQLKIQDLIGIELFDSSIGEIYLNEKRRRLQLKQSKLYKTKLTELQQQYKTNRFARNMNQKDLFKILLGREFPQYDRKENAQKQYVTDIEQMSTPVEIRILLITEIIKTKLKQPFRCNCSICNVIIKSRQDFAYNVNNVQLYQICQMMMSSISSKGKKSEILTVYYSIIHENLYHLTKSPAQLIINDSKMMMDSLIINYLINLFIEINVKPPDTPQSTLFKKFALPTLIISPTDNFILTKVLSQLQLNDALLDPFVKNNGLIDYDQLKKYMKSIQDDHDSE